jgi:hypothetical protein
MKSVRAQREKELARVAANPSLASFRGKEPPIPTVDSVVQLAPCVELQYTDKLPYLADILFAFTDKRVATLAERAQHHGATLTPAERNLLAHPPVYLFVHWHEWLSKSIVVDAGGIKRMVDSLTVPAGVSYLGKDYSILLASDREELGLLRRVHNVPQLGDVEPLLPVSMLAAAGPITGARSARGPPLYFRLPCVQVWNSAGKVELVRRRVSLSAHPFLYVG